MVGIPTILIACNAILVALLALMIGLAARQWPLGVSCEASCPLLDDSAIGAACSAEASEGKLEDLDSKGFAVVRNFLPADMREKVLKLYEDLESGELEHGDLVSKEQCPTVFGFNVFQKVPGLLGRIEELGTMVEKKAGGRIVTSSSKTNGSMYDSFFLLLDSEQPKRSQPLSWHQDQDPYWLYQDFQNYLTLYIPLSTPIGGPGFSVVPFDSLRAHSPELYALTVGRGATSFLPAKNGLVMDDRNDDRRYRLPYHLDNFSCSPKLSGGDILALRGDAIYRTLSDSSRQVFLSIRVRPARWPFNVEKFFDGGFSKYSSLWRQSNLYDKRIACALGEELDTEELYGVRTKVGWRISLGTFYLTALYVFRRLLDLILVA